MNFNFYNQPEYDLNKSLISEMISLYGIQIKFGQENDDFIIGNSSMIVSKYKKGSKTAGSLGIIGPMRIDYAKIIPYVEYFTEKLTLLMSDDVPDDESNK